MTPTLMKGRKLQGEPIQVPSVAIPFRTPCRHDNARPASLYWWMHCVSRLTDQTGHAMI